MTDFRKNVDPKLRRKTDTSLLELNNLKAEYKASKLKADKAEKRLENEKAKLKDARTNAERAENALSDIQVEIDSDYLPEGAQPRPRIHKRDKIAQELAQLEAALEAQQQATQSARDDFMECEKVMFQADRDLNRFAETLEDTLLAMATIKELDKDKAERLARMEKETASRKERDRAREEEAREAQARELAALQATREATARKLNKVAKAKVAETTDRLKDVTSQIREVHEAQQADRTEAVLELKTNVNAVNAKLAGQADRYRKKVADAAQRLEDEKDALLSKGLNPYVEFRRKELDAEAEAREQKMRDSVEKNKVELAIRIAKEQRFQDRLNKERRKAEEYERKHRDSQGRQVVEGRNADYIVSKTMDNREVLDPTGRLARVNPSQVTDIPDFSFGLGKSQRIPESGVKRIAALMRHTLSVDEGDLGEYQHLVDELQRSTAAQRASAEVAEGQDDSDDEGGGLPGVGGAPADRAQSAPQVSNAAFTGLETLTNQRGAMPGTDKAALTVNLKGSEIEKAALLKIVVEEEGDKGKGAGASSIASAGSPKYKLAQMSKFERDALDRAIDRHQDRIELGVEQVAGGRTFHGQSFVAKPGEIIFKDFEVGKKYRRTFTMTNVSYTFNSFKLLDFEDAVIDFFIVTFEKPGKLSPGMSCTLEVAFTPQVNADIFTHFRFLTETGPVNIPLKCLIRRCAPRVMTPFIDFGPVVMGQILTQPLRIDNTQAIGTNFSVYPIVEQQPPVVELLPEEEGEGGAAKQSEVAVSPRGELEAPEGGENIGSEPALNEAELGARVQRVMTAVWRAKKKANPQPISCNLVDSVIDGYSTTSLTITCAPLTVGPIEQKFSVIFDSVQDAYGSVDPQGQLITREQLVTVTTQGEEVPIFVEEETMDLRCTLFDRIYRQRLVVKNRGKAAFRVIVKISKAFAPFVEVNPTMFFVQAKSSQSMNVKFTPTLDILSSLAHFSLPYENFTNAALLQLPIEIQVVNQELPVYFILKSSVTPSTVVLSTPSLEFGKIYVGQQSTQKITLTNTSMLPQKVAFVRMKKEFSVSPNDGFAVLLPNESLEFEVSFCPLSAINYELDLTLLTSFNDSYTIKVIAEGVEPPLVFSSAVIQMRTTGPGERVLASTTVQNTTKRVQSFEVMLPDKRFSWLTVSPTVVTLEPGKSQRLEVEYCPPEDAAGLDPTEWHSKLLAAGGAAGSPFEEWLADSGWVFASGMYGGIQWVKAGAGKPEDPPAVEAPTAAAEGEEQQVQEARSHEVEFSDVPAEEWGVVGKWNLPVMIKSRRRMPSSPSHGDTLGSPAASLSASMTGGFGGGGGGVPSPLYLSVQTAVTLPQLDADMKLIDFGQISVGTRQLKTFKVFNKGPYAIKLKTIGLNAVGPFTLLRPIREILPGESRIVIVECLPMLPGLVVEVLEISPEDETIGGHRLRITIRVQGLKPSVDLEGLAPPPANWNPRSGILDFGNVLVNDVIVKKFTIRNKSTFSVDARIVRVAGFGLPPQQQSELVERTAGGMPILSIRPERVQIARGQAEEIEVTFRPDRGRFQPFREDVDVMIGETDEILRVGLFGRCWSRQLFVAPDNPRDEAYVNVLFEGTSSVEDLLAGHSSAAIRASAVEAQASLKLKCPPAPEITLEFQDPFSPKADPSSYTSMDAPPAGGKAPAKGAAPAAPSGARQQTKRLVVSSARVQDGRPGVGPGSFEVILGAEAKAAGIWSLSTDKGAITPTADVPVDIICTQPKPRSLGGIFVGSWKSYSAEIVVKGGWAAQGEGDENRVQVTLKAFVSL